MKKKILGGIAVLAIVAVAAFNVILNTNQKSDMSLLALANVEALAGNESGGGISVTSCLGIWGTCTLPNGTIHKLLRYRSIFKDKGPLLKH